MQRDNEQRLKQKSMLFTVDVVSPSPENGEIGDMEIPLVRSRGLNGTERSSIPRTAVQLCVVRLLESVATLTIRF